ncbi:tetratricopeptide repeat protein, partial [bacterium]|nr:tetratricopeptide repeat protein [bacterium]
MPRLIIIAIFLISIFPSVTIAGEKEELSLAKKAYFDGLYDLASEQLVKILRAYPRTKQADKVHFLLGECLFNQGKFSRAQEEYRTVLNEYRASELREKASYRIGECYYEEKEFDGA